jgi:hypothetical protein
MRSSYSLYYRNERKDIANPLKSINRQRIRIAAYSYLT